MLRQHLHGFGDDRLDPDVQSSRFPSRIDAFLDQAKVLVEDGVLDADAQLDAAYLRDQVLPLLLDRERLSTMADAARGFGITDAAEVLAEIVISAARRA